MATPFKIRVSPQAERDIEEVLAWTLDNFGEGKRAEYESLIRLALKEVAHNPDIGRSRPELHERARTLHIARPGKRARHFFLLRIVDDNLVEIGRFLYDGMDLASHLPQGYES